MNQFHQKEEWSTEIMATYKDKPKRIDWAVALVYSAIFAAAGLACFAIKCGHAVTLFGGWVLLGGLWLVSDAKDRRLLRGSATFVAGLAAIIAGSVMMGAGK